MHCLRKRALGSGLGSQGERQMRNIVRRLCAKATQSGGAKSRGKICVDEFTLNPQPIVLEVDIIDVIDAEAHTE